MSGQMSFSAARLFKLLYKKIDKEAILNLKTDLLDYFKYTSTGVFNGMV